MVVVISLYLFENDLEIGVGIEDQWLSWVIVVIMMNFIGFQRRYVEFQRSENKIILFCFVEYFCWERIGGS